MGLFWFLIIISKEMRIFIRKGMEFLERKYGDKWETEFKNNETAVGQNVLITDYVDHNVEESAKVF